MAACLSRLTTLSLGKTTADFIVVGAVAVVVVPFLLFVVVLLLGTGGLGFLEVLEFVAPLLSFCFKSEDEVAQSDDDDGDPQRFRSPVCCNRLLRNSIVQSSRLTCCFLPLLLLYRRVGGITQNATTATALIIPFGLVSSLFRRFQYSHTSHIAAAAVGRSCGPFRLGAMVGCWIKLKV